MNSRLRQHDDTEIYKRISASRINIHRRQQNSTTRLRYMYGGRINVSMLALLRRHFIKVRVILCREPRMRGKLGGIARYFFHPSQRTHLHRTTHAQPAIRMASVQSSQDRHDTNQSPITQSPASRRISEDADKAEDGESSDESAAADGQRKRKRTSRPISISCELCKQRKVKCDRGRPSCGWCLRNGQMCEYKERRKPGLRNLKRSSQKRYMF